MYPWHEGADGYTWVVAQYTMGLSLLEKGFSVTRRVPDDNNATFYYRMRSKL